MKHDKGAFDQQRHSGVRPMVLCVGVLWVTLSIVMYVLILLGLGEWIELFNGATWPTVLGQAPKSNGVATVPFSVVLAARTLLNLGGAWAIFYATFWFVFGGKERAMARSVANVIKAQEKLLEFSLISFLEKNKERRIDEALVAEFKQAIVDFHQSRAGRRMEEEVLSLSRQAGAH